MKKTKTTTKKPPKPSAIARRSVTPMPVAPVTTNTNTTSTAMAPTVRPARARMSRRGLGPAQRLASELTRYLRIHSKHPYGRRGEQAILDLAGRVTQAAQQESKTFAACFAEYNLPFVAASLAALRAKHEANVEPVATESQ
jgi:hypothetical protein